MKFKLLLLCLLFAGLALSCNLSKLPFLGPTPTPEPSPTPTLTPTPPPTSTPIPTPTPLPAERIASGDHALFIGDWDAALLGYDLARQESSDPDIQTAALLGIGRTQLLAGKFQESIATLESLVQNYPQSPHLAEAHFFLGQAYSKMERYADSAQAYLNYLTLRSGVANAYILDLRGDALFAAGDYRGAINDFLAASQSPSLLDGTFLSMKMARSYALAGDYNNALTLYDSLYNSTNNDHTRALIDLRKGQVYAGLGQIDLAYTAYQDAVNNYPTAYEAYSALLTLVEAGIPVDELNRGLVDYYAGEYGVALAAFDRYLQKNPADPGTARYYSGLTTRALGGYEGAIAEWDKVIQNYPDHRFWDNAWEEKAYTQWSYLDQYTRAIQTLLDFVEAVPNHPRAGEFLFDAAQVAERAGQLKKAADLWQRVYNEYPNYEQANRALFLAGISRYRQEDYPGALTIFQYVLSVASTLQERSSASLWIGKTQAAQDDQVGARSTWEQTAAIDPTGYYSERALDLLDSRPAFSPPAMFDLSADQVGEREKADTWLRTIFNLPEGTDLSGLGDLSNDTYVLRGTELWRLGLFAEARAEFEQLRKSIEADPVQTYRLASYLAELGIYRSATMAARQVLTLAGMTDATTMTAPTYFNRLRFGTYYSELIIPNAQEYNFHPLFLFSVVRQESLFESFVRSSAAASGLMQIIPSTAQSLAQKLEWPPNYTTDDLNRPLVNVRFGVDYLAAQRDSFDGDLYAALAAYNGGPGNARQWKKLAPDDPDLFLEVIRFSETRNYIRGVYEIFSIYRRLYDRTP